MLMTLIRRDLRRAWGSGEIGLPVVFFLICTTLFPFAVGPDAALLQRVGGGVLWVAAVLAALLPIDRLIAPDHENGLLDQLALRGIADEWVAGRRIAAHAIAFGVPLLLALPVAAALLNLTLATTITLAMGLAMAAPGLASLALLSATLTARRRGGSAVGGLLVLPLAMPMLIFGSGMADPAAQGALPLLASASLLLTAIGPFAAGAGLRALRE